MAKYLITGGAGFIGSNFLQALVQEKTNEICCLDKFSYAVLEHNLVSIKGKNGFRLVKGDITKTSDLEKVWSTPFDYVINFAAESHVDRSIDEPTLFFANNLMGTINLLNYCLLKKPKLFIQISTDEVYGSISSPDLATEKSPINPSNPYSASKCSADLAALSFKKTFNLPVIILRAVNNFGPHQYPEKFIPKIIIRALQEKEIPIYGKGEAIRTWLYVKDFGKAISQAIKHGKSGEIYNIGTKNELSNMELVVNILNLLGKNKSLIKYVADRPGHDLRYALDYTKAKQELAWNESYSFPEALQETVAWYKNNFSYFEKLVDKYI